MSGNGSVFGEASLQVSDINDMVIVLQGNCKFGGASSFDGLKTPVDFVNKYGRFNVEVRLSENQRTVIFLTDVWDMG